MQAKRMNLRPAVLMTAAGFLLAASRIASAQASVATRTTGTARLIGGIQLTKTADLSFGDLVPGATAGTVRVATGGARTRTGGVTLAAGTVSQATLTVQGQRNKSYTITVPPSVTVTSGANSMTVGSIITAPTSPNTLPNSGTRALRVGATLNVLPNQPSGTYSSTFDVTVAYD